MPNNLGNHTEDLKFSLDLGRASAIYAEKTFTVSIKVENMSNKPVYLFSFGIMASAHFTFKRSIDAETFPPRITLTEKIESFIFYILSIKLRFEKAYSTYKVENGLEDPSQEVPQEIPQEIWRNLFGIIGAVMLSVLTVIALSRKTGAQTLVTIQDFWGGVFIGFLIGYSGKTLFEKLIGVT